VFVVVLNVVVEVVVLVIFKLPPTSPVPPDPPFEPIPTEVLPLPAAVPLIPVPVVCAEPVVLPVVDVLFRPRAKYAPKRIRSNNIIATAHPELELPRSVL
jgi:hypothetical protein